MCVEGVCSFFSILTFSKHLHTHMHLSLSLSLFLSLSLSHKPVYSALRAGVPLENKDLDSYIHIHRHTYIYHTYTCIQRLASRSDSGEQGFSKSSNRANKESRVMPALMRACTHVRMNCRARYVIFIRSAPTACVCVCVCVCECVCVGMRARHLFPLGPRQPPQNLRRK